MTLNWINSTAAIYSLDLETGALQKRFELKDDFLGAVSADGISGFRVDYFAIKGDITKDAILMFPCSGSDHVIRCDIENGQLKEQKVRCMWI